MDYDDNEFHGQNLQLAGEGCFKVSPVLQFDFNDSLQGHLRFESSVENEGFIGLTSPEDNQWIEEYSRGSSGIEFSSSAVESRHNNVWSEATSSESVEILLKSVGQEEKVVGKPIIQQLDISNEPGSVTEVMDPNLNQEVRKDAHQITSDAYAASSDNLPDMGVGGSIDPVGNILKASCSLDEVLAKEFQNEDVISVKNTSVVLSVDKDTNTNFPAKSSGTVVNQDVHSLDNKKNIEPSDKRSSLDTSDGSHLLSGSLAAAETDDQPKSPIFGVSLVHHDNQEKEEVEYPCDDNSQSEILQVEILVDSASKNPSSSVEKEPSPDLAEKVVHELDVHASSEKRNNSGIEGIPNPKESIIEINKLNEHQTFVDVARSSDCDANHIRQDVGSKTTDDTEGNIQSVSSSKATQEEQNFTFEVNKSASVGQAGKGFQSYPTFQVSTLPKVTDTQVDAKKLREVSLSLQNPSGLTSQIKVKGKSEHKPRRKSVGKETTPARDSVRVEKPSVLLTPPATGQIIPHQVKSNKNVDRGGTIPRGVLSLPKLPGLNHSTIFRQTFTDNQQVQLRAQILVYGSLISGSPPEEPHMIAAFGQSDGVKTWEGVWRASLERLHVNKVKTNSNTPIQISNYKITPSPIEGATKMITSSPIVGPMIPLSLPLWNTPAMQNFNAHNPSWLSPGPFSGQWVAAFNTGPRFPALPVTEAVKLTTVKESTGPIFTASSDKPSTDSKTRKRKKSTNSLNFKQISDRSPAVIAQNQIDSVTVPVVSGLFSSSVPVSDKNMENFLVSDETLSKVEEAKLHAEAAAERAAAALSHRHVVWNQLERRDNSGLNLNSDDEAKLVSSAISIAAAASVAKVAAAAAKIASDIAEEARSIVNVSQNSVIYDARQRSKHVENCNAIVKATELAAEAVSEAGKIVAMSESLPKRHLVETGPEGYWKTLGLSRKENSRDLAEIQKMEVDKISVPFTSREKNKRKPRVRKGPDLYRTFVVAPELEIGSIDTSIVGQTVPKVTSVALEENNIKEGCLVEVYKDDDKYSGAWFGANILSLKDRKALVCYTEIQSDEGSGQLKEWVPLEVESTEVPRIRIAHPMTTMRLEGSRKRRRAAVVDFVWSSGDRVDVWIHDRWVEGIVLETNKIDRTSLTVQFPVSAQGEKSVVQSWLVRPTLIWKDGKWVESQTSEQRLSSQGDAPQNKWLKSGSPVVEGKKKDGSSENVDLVDQKNPKESRTLPSSTNESLFSIGSTKDDKWLGPRVIFGVPKQGKNQKFMDVSKHYVGDGSNKNNRTHDYVKFTRYLIPQPPGSRSADEKLTSESKPRMIKPRKPPVSSVRTINKTTMDSDRSAHRNPMDFGSSSNVEDAPRSAHRNFIPTGGKPVKFEKSLPESVEPRRSNRKIQPTSRLLEGLQSSMTMAKIPDASHSAPKRKHQQ